MIERITIIIRNTYFTKELKYPKRHVYYILIKYKY